MGSEMCIRDSFNRTERVRSKSKYSRRKVFWDKVMEMVRAGYINVTTIDKIYDVYGKKEVSGILKCMIAHRRTGWPDELRFV